MASVVEICNMALTHLGAYTINSLDEATQEARKCKLFYEDSRDFVLRGFPWNFAEKRVYLAEMGSSESSVGYDYAYAYPSDCLKARKIYNQIATGEPIKYIITGTDDLTSKKILTDQEDALLIYTGKVTDPNVFDVSFIVALSFLLASFLAMPLTKQPAMLQTMLEAYGRVVGGASAVNAGEDHDDTEPENQFIAARG